MAIDQISEFEMCATCGKPAEPGSFSKKIIRSELYFCSQACLDMCCCVMSIQIGAAIVFGAVVLSFCFSPVFLPLALIGTWPFISGLRGAQKCVYKCPKKGNHADLDPETFDPDDYT